MEIIGRISITAPLLPLLLECGLRRSIRNLLTTGFDYFLDFLADKLMEAGRFRLQFIPELVLSGKAPRLIGFHCCQPNGSRRWKQPHTRLTLAAPRH